VLEGRDVPSDGLRRRDKKTGSALSKRGTVVMPTHSFPPPCRGTIGTGCLRYDSRKPITGREIFGGYGPIHRPFKVKPPADTLRESGSTLAPPSTAHPIAFFIQGCRDAPSAGTR